MLPIRSPDVRAQLKKPLCVKVRGSVVIEDYERIKSIAHVFPDVVKLINKSAESKLRESAEFLRLKGELEQAEENIKQEQRS